MIRTVVCVQQLKGDYALVIDQRQARPERHIQGCEPEYMIGQPVYCYEY